MATTATRPAAALPVLMYHHVSPVPGLVTLPPELFRAQMERLVREGWHSVGCAELEAFLAGQALPAKSVMITFDDGYLDNFVHAHPVLESLGLHAVMFVVTGWLGDGPVRSGQQACPGHDECKTRIAAGDPDSVIVRWSELEVMQAAGTFEFHSHTHSHARWDRLVDDESARRSALAEDLCRSREALKARLGFNDRHLCWPQGYFQPVYPAVAKEQGFDHLYTTRPGTNLPQGDALDIRRIVAKDKPAPWLTRRLGIYSSPLLSRLYSGLKGSGA